MGAQMIRDVDDRDLPLCPQYTGNPADPLHTVATLVLNAFYDAAPKDKNGCFRSADVDKAYAAAQAKFSDRMPLYRAGTGYGNGTPRRQYVEVYYFRCQVCGFTLPAGPAQPAAGPVRFPRDVS